MSELQPFQNERETLQIGELTIENRIDQLELYGSLRLKALLDAAILHLQNEKDLPEQVFFKSTDHIDNPFKN